MTQQETYLKRATVLLLLFIYAVGVIKPIMPLVKDVLAHSFFKASQVATVHYEKGKYHIHLELIEAKEQNNSQEAPAVSESGCIASHIKTEEMNVHCVLQYMMEINTPYENHSIALFQTPPFLPPKM